MNTQLTAIVAALHSINNGVKEVVVYHTDLPSIRTVLNEVGYIYTEKPTNHVYTKITIK